MHIVIVAGPWLPVPAIEGGSTSRHWQGVAAEFVKLGYDVTILSKKHPRQCDRETIDGVQYIRTPGARQTGIIVIDLIKDLIYALRTLFLIPRADCVILNDFWLSCLIQFRKKHFKKVLSFLGRMPKGQLGLYGGLDTLVVSTQAVVTEVLKQSPSFKERIAIIPCSVDDSFYEAEEKRTPAQVLYVGRVHPEKGIDILLDACRELPVDFPELQLTIVGPAEKAHGGGGQSYLEALKKRVSDAPVTFYGPEYDDMKLASLYAAADIFVYPSCAEQGETFGLAPVESMAAGCVPVVSALECFQGQIVHKKNGMVFDHRASDPSEKLAQCLKELLQNDSLKESLRLQARADAEQYRYKSIAESYRDLLHDS